MAEEVVKFIRAYLKRLFGAREVRPCFPWIKTLREADPEWWATCKHHIPSIALERFIDRNPAHPLTDWLKRELCPKS